MRPGGINRLGLEASSALRLAGRRCHCLIFYLGDDAEKKGDESRGTKAAVMLLSVPTAREKTQSEGIVTTDDTSASLIQP